MKEINGGYFDGERALFASRDLKITGAVFADGESPLKESHGITLVDSTFGWKYPLWYSTDVRVIGGALYETARSGIWYTNGIEMTDTRIEAPKTFRRSSGIRLTRVSMPNAAETLWHCRDVKMTDVSATGDYFGMNCHDVECDGFTLLGNYIFDGAEGVTVRNSKLISKDAFWNARNVTVIDSVIEGEYLGWNSENVTFVNCTIESNQGLCYMKNVRLVGCKTVNTDLAFEYSTVDAEICGSIDSIKNPTSGVIRADSIGEVTVDERYTDPKKISIITNER